MPALGIFRFVNMLLKALKGDTNCVDCAFIRQTGHIGQFLPYMISIVRFGKYIFTFLDLFRVILNLFKVVME